MIYETETPEPEAPKPEPEDDEQLPAATDTVVELDPVLAWRISILIEAGYETDHAFLLAAAEHVDLHQAAYLRQTGCAETVALRILL